ncbi:hypothetical protein [Desulfoluna sp.]|uniref:hypothetical protein n=1 Tax=Desulfoluna sp. TaxID=2045199 RepID=UPI0026359E9B|nr:hypothetical protein [Desulfoluna sp.]
MRKQITYTADTVEDIMATLDRDAAIIEVLVGVIVRGECLSAENATWLEESWKQDILRCIKRVETEGRYV